MTKEQERAAILLSIKETKAKCAEDISYLIFSLKTYPEHYKSLGYPSFQAYCEAKCKNMEKEVEKLINAWEKKWLKFEKGE